MTASETFEEQVRDLERRWAAHERWSGIRREYGAQDVVRLRGSVGIEHTLARLGAERLWRLLHEEPYVATFGAETGAQAVQMVRAGLKAIYVSGWQVAADANLAGQTYPDQSLYPSDSVPALVRRLNSALLRADQVEWSETAGRGASPGEVVDQGQAPGSNGNGVHPSTSNGHSAGGPEASARTTPEDGRASRWLVPILADAEAGFGGTIHAFELMRSMIEAGAAGVHFEDQLAAEKKCGHMGGKVLVPTGQFIRTLKAARLAADVQDVPTVLVARTDALSATLLTSDVDPRDQRFLTGERTVEGYHVVRGVLESAIARSLEYAPYADMLWFETARPDLEQARAFAEAIHARYPGKLLAYNCSPSFNWEANLDPGAIAGFQQELAAMGYRFQFITLAGWHLVNFHAYDLAAAYRNEGMTAYVRLQQQEFARQRDGYTAVRHQWEAGAGYFDQVALTVSAGETSTTALTGSTEREQF
ncbi:isocitrate lyase family protein [Limnochorda pilosa]|uniref:isocitrate lyase n=1 Tax=Limnochorda pilosa TaxID=1555112 RepID=A0A0K2SIE2_LIMPI|nr:isocitrate lyase [Limnochorda pilosa]BAS26855.1 isocitrate lyase [Limnochorda pilosa]